MAITTIQDRRYYITVRDPQNGTSKTVTIRGPRLSAARLLKLVVSTLRTQQHRKAG